MGVYKKMKQLSSLKISSTILFLTFHIVKTFGNGHIIDTIGKNGKRSFLLLPESEPKREKECNCGIPNISRTPDYIIGGHDAENSKWLMRALWKFGLAYSKFTNQIYNRNQIGKTKSPRNFSFWLKFSRSLPPFEILIEYATFISTFKIK